MGIKRDTAHLERMNGGKWRVSVKVPDAARPVIGSARLKRSLGTDSLEEANRLKWPVVAEFQAKIAQALGRDPEGYLEGRALVYREQLARAAWEEDAPGDLGYSEGELVDLEIAQEAEALAGPPIGVGHDGMPIHDPAKAAQARRFMEIARGKVTPLRGPEGDFRGQKGTNWAPKTWGKFDLIMIKLEAWLRGKRGGAAVEAVDRKAAGDFLAETQRAMGWTAKTCNSYLSCLSTYWKWMEKRGLIEGNPWDRQRLETPRKAKEEEERPFTREEMRRLLGGDPPGYLGDLIRLAALTGARLGALVQLRVKDCQGDVFLFQPQKREPGVRRVPIHPDLRAIVARRCEGKPGDAWLFPEVPPAVNPKVARGDKAGKAYRRYAEGLGVVDNVPGTRRDRINFHSFRRWFITEAQEALTAGASGYTETTISEVVGHKVEGMTMGTYKGAASDAQRRACVEAVRLP